MPAELIWGEEAIEEELCGLRFRLRPNAFLQTNTGMAERLYALAGEYAGLGGRGDRLGSVLRYRHDRADAGQAGALGLGDRDLRGIGRLRTRERGAQLGRQHRLLRRQRRSGDPRAEGSFRAARRRRGRPAARRAGRQGPAPPGRDRGAAHRLRLLQPDHSRRRLQAAARAGRLRAGTRSAAWTCSRTRRTSRRSRCSSETFQTERRQ